MIFLAIGIIAYIVYPPAVTYVALTWAALICFSFTYTIFKEVNDDL
jgi:hypothetical protein